MSAFMDNPNWGDHLDLEPKYTAAKDWWVRISVANDYNLAVMVKKLEFRTGGSVQNYINGHRL